MRYKVKNSRQVQEYLFQIGYCWGDLSTEVSQLDKEYLVVLSCSKFVNKQPIFLYYTDDMSDREKAELTDVGFESLRLHLYSYQMQKVCCEIDALENHCVALNNIDRFNRQIGFRVVDDNNTDAEKLAVYVLGNGL